MEEEAEGLLQDPSTGVLEPPKYDMPRRRPWAPEEVRMLYKAVSKHGAGKWKEILEDEEFAHAFMGRVNGNLKVRFTRAGDWFYACFSRLLGCRYEQRSSLPLQYEQSFCSDGTDDESQGG